MSSGPSPMEVSAIMREIRERVRARRARNGAVGKGREAEPAAPEMYLERLTRATLELRGAIGRLGDMPAQPPTWRARAGAVLVQVVRRCLFWHTEQVREVQWAAVAALEEQTRAIESLAAALRQLWNLDGERAGRQAVAMDELQARLAEIEMAMAELKAEGVEKAAGAYPGARP